MDLAPTFVDLAQAGEEFYFRQNAHLNAAGHRLAAELIADYLDKPSQRPRTTSSVRVVKRSR